MWALSARADDVDSVDAHRDILSADIHSLPASFSGHWIKQHNLVGGA
ncbi:MAG: hypothetical protein GXP17_02345 [Gammaproteobacteria bacterium]|nr:hypothetical protein [Gammaproteobacteria bacterium]